MFPSRLFTSGLSHKQLGFANVEKKLLGTSQIMDDSSVKLDSPKRHLHLQKEIYDTRYFQSFRKTVVILGPIPLVPIMTLYKVF